MTKRPHPEGGSAENSPMQLKTHVGEKEVNEGANSEDNMKKVYEKTMNMLMEGAREQAKQEKEEEKAEEEVKEEKESTEEEAKVEPGQMYLNTKGEIAGVYVAVPEDDKKETDKKEEESKMEEGGDSDSKKVENGEGKTENGDEKTENGEEKMENGDSKKENGQGDADVAKDEDQPSLEQFGFKVDECKHTSPIKAARISPHNSPAKSPFKLEKRPLKLDEKMEEDK